jgi:hypothetical protein
LPIDFFTAYDGSEEMEKAIKSCPLVTTALCGHSHVKKDVMIGKIRAMTNPVGYLKKEHSKMLAEIAAEKITMLEI